jgi:predicted PurR-regulated permease PerM
MRSACILAAAFWWVLYALRPVWVELVFAIGWTVATGYVVVRLQVTDEARRVEEQDPDSLL